MSEWCFGSFNADERACNSICKAAKACKAFMITDALDVVADTLETLVEILPEREGGYPEAFSATAIVALIKDPNLGFTKSEFPKPEEVGVFQKL